MLKKSDLAKVRDSWCWPKGMQPLGMRMAQNKTAMAKHMPAAIICRPTEYLLVNSDYWQSPRNTGYGWLHLIFPWCCTVWVKLPVFDRIQPYSNKFATSVGKEAAGDSKRDESPDLSKDFWPTQSYQASFCSFPLKVLDTMLPPKKVLDTAI